MVQREENRGCVEVVSEQEAREHLGDRFEAQIEAGRKREAAIRDFDAELSRGGDVVGRFERDPTALLEERGILRPLDKLELQLDVPGLPDLPGQEVPDLRFHCRWLCYFYWEWVCIWVAGRPFCFRRLRFRCVRVCFPW